jgi:hypothetical protein
MFTEPLPSNGSLFWLSGAGTHTQTPKHQGDLMGFRLFFKNKESRLKMDVREMEWSDVDWT